MNPKQAASRHTTLTMAIATSLLTACGGGGGDGSSSPNVVVPTATRTVAASAGADVTADNLAALGGWLARSVLSASGDGAFGIVGERESPQTSAMPAASRVDLPMHARTVRAALRLATPLLAAREQAAAVRSGTEACENAGGSLAFTLDDADNNNKLSAGDLFTVVTTNCVLEAGLPAASGTLQVGVNAIELSADDEPVALDVNATTTNFSVGSYGTYNGAMRMWNRPEGAGDRSRVSFSGASVAYGDTTLRFDFDFYGLTSSMSSNASGTFDLNGGLGISGQTYSVVGGDVFVAGGSNPPSAGSVRLRDGAGDTVLLTARSASTFDLAYLPAGAPVPTVTLPGLRWADYLVLPQ